MKDRKFNGVRGSCDSYLDRTNIQPLARPALAERHFTSEHGVLIIHTPATYRIRRGGNKTRRQMSRREAEANG